MKYFVFTISMLMFMHNTNAATLTLPKHSELLFLYKEVARYEWQKIELEEKSTSIENLSPGNYNYSIQLESASGELLGEFEITDDDSYFIHRAITPNRTTVYAWASTALRNSEEYKLERDDKYCRGIQQYLTEDYVLESCKRLAEKDHPEALYQLGFAYDKGIGVSANTTTSTEYYLRAHKQGHDLAGLGYYYSDVYNANGRKVVKELAEKGNVFAAEAHLNVILFSEEGKKNPPPNEQVLSIAWRAVNNGGVVTLMTLSDYYYAQEYKCDDCIVKAKAFYDLYALNTPMLEFRDQRFGNLIEEALPPESEQLIASTKAKLVANNVTQSLTIYLDPALLKLTGKSRVKVHVNNNVYIALPNNKQTITFPLFANFVEHEIAIYFDDEYQGQVEFRLGDVFSNKLCLVYDEKNIELKLAPSRDLPTQCNTQDTVEAWNLMTGSNG